MSENLTTCKTCGAEIAKTAKICPHCGAKIKKPIYKKWWFYLLLVFVLASVLADGSDDKQAEIAYKSAIPVEASLPAESGKSVNENESVQSKQEEPQSDLTTGQKTL